MFVRRRQILTKAFAPKTDYTRACLGHKLNYKVTLFYSTSEALGLRKKKEKNDFYEAEPA